MIKYSIVFILIGVAMVSTACSTSTIKGENSILSKTPFGICYSKITPSQIVNYELVIVEPDFYSKTEIDALKATGVTVIGYITLGEVDSNRWYYPVLEERGFIGINENWNSAYLNLSDDVTRSLILDKVVPEIMIKGFDGLFLDTIDAVSPYTERKELAPYMSELIQNIRSQYPSTTIIQNAGLFLLDETHTIVDAVLIEDIASGYNFDDKSYFIKDFEAYKKRVDLLKSNVNKYDLPFFVVDFAENENAISEVKSRLDTLYVPYFISNIQLNELPILPGDRANKLKGN